MATVNGITKPNNKITTAPTTLAAVLNGVNVQKRFEKMLGDEAGAFLSSVLTICNSNKLLQAADYRTILAAAATTASLKLSLAPTLGQAYIVPYKGAAQFQIGYRGLIDLAQRSCRMRKIIMTPVYEGELQNWCRFDETYTINPPMSREVVGYFAAIETIEGFRKASYWLKEDVIAHAKKFSKAYNKGPWQTDFDAMACKTVLIPILKTYAPKSIELLTALNNDGKVAVMDESTGEQEFIDVDASGADDTQEQQAEVNEAVEAHEVPMPENMFEQ